MELTKEALGAREIERLAVVHVAVPEEAQAFAKEIVQAPPYTGEVIFAELTPGLSVHTGAGMLGVVVIAASA